MSLRLLIADPHSSENYANIFERPTAQDARAFQAMEEVLFDGLLPVKDSVGLSWDVQCVADMKAFGAHLDSAMVADLPFLVVILDKSIGTSAEIIKATKAYHAHFKHTFYITLGELSAHAEAQYQSCFAPFWVNFTKPVSIPTFKQTVLCFAQLVDLLPLTPLQSEVDRRILQKKVAALKTKLEESRRLMRAQRRHYAGVVHELRNPLGGMIGILEVLSKDPQLPPEQHDMIDVMLENSELLVRIIADTLDMAAMDTDDLRFKTEVFNLKETVASCVRLKRPKASRKNLEINDKVSSELPTHLLGDSGRLRQLLFNFLSNAIKYTDQGSITILANPVVSADPEQVRIHFCVCDSGIGITEQDLDYLFQPYHRLGNASGRGSGAGLGLAICKQIVERMKGRIWVKSQPGKGSQFQMELPFALPDQAQILAFEKKRNRFNPQPEVLDKQVQGRVLVVEDHPTNAKVARLHLESMGLDVAWVENGLEALELLAITPDFDLIVMDIQMPRLDGIEATRRIRQNLQLKMPIIAMTANILEENKGECLDVGMDDFIAKPVRKVAYLDMVKRWLLITQKNHEVSENQIEAELIENPPNDAMNIIEKPLDYKQAVAEFEGDEQLVKALIHDWLDQCEDDLAAIWKHLEKEDWHGVKVFAHRLKGSASNICAEPLCRNAKALELTAKKQKKDAIVGHYFKLQRCYGVLVSYLEWQGIWSP